MTHITLTKEEFEAVKAALRDYVAAQSRMLGKWADGDKNVKNQLWKQLHSLEVTGREILEILAKHEGGGDEIRQSIKDAVKEVGRMKYVPEHFSQHIGDLTILHRKETQ